MGFGIIDTSTLTAIANAIRTKLGVQTTYKPSEMATAIGQISGGGVTPTGTKEITANGTNIDVASYAYADVAVPNSYAAGDEGKVVSNGALVDQTSDSVTQNGTVDTTLINSLTVNVSGGGQSIPYLISYEAINITSDLSSYTTNDFQSDYLPSMNRPFQTIIYLIENTNTDSSYAAQAAARLSTLSNDYSSATTRVYIRSGGTTSAGNNAFKIGKGSVLHKYVFGVASS